MICNCKEIYGAGQRASGNGVELPTSDSPPNPTKRTLQSEAGAGS
jgi:hypothetical protein